MSYQKKVSSKSAHKPTLISSTCFDNNLPLHANQCLTPINVRQEIQKLLMQEEQVSPKYQLNLSQLQQLNAITVKVIEGNLLYPNIMNLCTRVWRTEFIPGSQPKWNQANRFELHNFLAGQNGAQIPTSSSNIQHTTLSSDSSSFSHQLNTKRSSSQAFFVSSPKANTTEIPDWNIDFILYHLNSQKNLEIELGRCRINLLMEQISTKNEWKTIESDQGQVGRVRIQYEFENEQLRQFIPLKTYTSSTQISDNKYSQSSQQKRLETATSIQSRKSGFISKTQFEGAAISFEEKKQILYGYAQKYMNLLEQEKIIKQNSLLRESQNVLNKQYKSVIKSPKNTDLQQNVALPRERTKSKEDYQNQITQQLNLAKRVVGNQNNFDCQLNQENESAPVDSHILIKEESKPSFHNIQEGSNQRIKISSGVPFEEIKNDQTQFYKFSRSNKQTPFTTNRNTPIQTGRTTPMKEGRGNTSQNNGFARDKCQSLHTISSKQGSHHTRIKSGLEKEEGLANKLININVKISQIKQSIFQKNLEIEAIKGIIKEI